MNDTNASTIRMDWTVPAPPSASSHTLANAAIAGSWVTFIAACCVPAGGGLPGWACFLGSFFCAASALGGETQDAQAGLLAIPNLVMLLSPIALFVARRRREVSPVFPFFAILGALLALAFPFRLMSHPLAIPQCGGMSSNFSPDCGAWLWISSMALLAAGLVGRAQKKA